MEKKDKVEIIIRFNLKNEEDKKIYEYIMYRDKNKYPYYKNYLSEAVKEFETEEDKKPVTKSDLIKVFQEHFPVNMMLP